MMNLRYNAEFNRMKESKNCLVHIFALELCPWSSVINKTIKKHIRNLKINSIGIMRIIKSKLVRQKRNAQYIRKIQAKYYKMLKDHELQMLGIAAYSKPFPLAS